MNQQLELLELHLHTLKWLFGVCLGGLKMVVYL